MRDYRNILVRGVNWLGDAIMTTPALHRLREAHPQSRIVLLTASKLADLWTGHPAIDGIIAFNAGEGVGRVAARLKTEKFDTALVLPNSLRSALEPWLAGIKRRIGYGGRGRSAFLTDVIERPPQHVSMHKRTPAEVKRIVRRHPEKPRDSYPPSAHQTWHYLHLAAALGAKSEPVRAHVAVSEMEKEAFHAKWRLSGERIFGLNAGAEYGPAKRWPVERFIRAAQVVSEERPATWIVFGGLGDLALANRVQNALSERVRIVNVAGQTTLRELCAGLSLCEAVLTNDTGPMHLAAAVGTKVIVPFGSTSPELTGPGFPANSPHAIVLGRAPCAPCFLRECPIDFRCMNSISAEEIARHFV